MTAHADTAASPSITDTTHDDPTIDAVDTIDDAPAFTTAKMDDALFDAGVVDLRAARILLEQSMGDGRAVALHELIEALRDAHPRIFASRHLDAGVMTLRATSPSSADRHRSALETLAKDARATGDRTAVLAYMRQRREAV